MEKNTEKEHVCTFCQKIFPSGKSLGGHIRIHTSKYSGSYNVKNPKKNSKKRLVDQREELIQQEQQFRCKECGKGFDSWKALRSHMNVHCEGEKKLGMDSQSDTETSPGPTKKRSKRVVMKQSNSESFSNGNSSSVSEIEQEEMNSAAWALVKMSKDPKGRNLVWNSRPESSEDKSEILETKLSSGEQLKTDKVAVVDEQLRSADDDGDDDCATLSDSDSDYYMNGPKNSDSDISVDGSLRNTPFGSGFNKFSNGDEVGVKEGGSKYELSKSKRVSPFDESDPCADTNNSKFYKYSDRKPPLVKKATGENKSSKVHECQICFRVFKTGQALGGHKRSHTIESQEHRNKHRAADLGIDLNLPATDSDE